MWRPGTPRSLRQESCEGDTRPAAIARRHGTKSSQGGGLELQSGYALPPFQATASRLTLIDAQSHLDCRAAAGVTPLPPPPQDTRIITDTARAVASDSLIMRASHVAWCPAGAGPLSTSHTRVEPRLFAGPGSYPGRVKGCSIRRAARRSGTRAMLTGRSSPRRDAGVNRLASAAMRCHPSRGSG